MNIILPPTTVSAASPSISVGADEHVIVALHKLNLGKITSGHKIQVEVDGSWEDYQLWPPREVTIIVHGPSEGSMNIRIFKEATNEPIGVRVA